MTSINEPPDDPITVFDRNTSRSFQRDLTRALLAECPEAHALCREHFDAPECHDVKSHVRRALVEQAVRGVAARHGYDALAMINASRSHYHTLIRAGRVILTISHVATPQTVVSSAEFRKTYARDTEQFLLFEENGLADLDSPLYALLIYGVLPENPLRPYFVQIVFPAPQGITYLRRIDLYRRFPDLLPGEAGSKPDDPKDGPGIRLRDDILPA